MALKIWKPKTYWEVWTEYNSSNASTGQTSTIINDPPKRWGINGQPKPYPENIDRLIREVPRFTGYKKSYYANTGEFKVLIEAGQIKPGDVDYSHIVDIDGDHFLIETIEWELTNEGYTCRIAGRDLSAIFEGFWPNGLHPYENALIFRNAGAGAKIEGLAYAIKEFFIGEGLRPNAKQSWDNFGLDPWPLCAGWFRDSTRLLDPSSADEYVYLDFEDESVLAKEAGSNRIGEIMNFGAQLQTACSWFGIGYNWRLVWDSEKQLYRPSIRFYNRINKGLSMNTKDRGISAFKWTRSRREEINGAIISGVSSWFASRDNGDMKTDKLDTKTKPIFRFVEHRGDMQSYFEYHNRLQCVFVDVGEVEDAAETSWEDVQDWLLAKAGETGGELFVNPENSIELTYDNSGFYKYGRDFGLGDKLTIIDDYLGVGVEKTLTAVQTNYNAGEALAFNFEFDVGKIDFVDKIKKKLAKIDRRTYAARKD